MATPQPLIPPPPPGFVLDAVPPPPPGFVLDAPGGSPSEPANAPQWQPGTPRDIGPPQDLSFAEKFVAPVLDAIQTAAQSVPVIGMPKGDVRNSPMMRAWSKPGRAAMEFAGGDARKLVADEERQYQASRGADAGKLDLPEIAMELANPMMWATGAALPRAASVAGRAAQASGLGGLFGLFQPTYAGDTGGDVFAADKTKQVGLSALLSSLFGPAIEGAGKALKPLRNAIDVRLPGGPERAASRLANATAGERAPQVIEALKNPEVFVPGSNPTAAEAAAKAGSTEFAGLERIAKGYLPSDYYARGNEQVAARRAAIQTIGKTPEALAAAKAERAANAAEAYDPIKSVRVDPRSDVQLMEDAIANRAASKASALQDEGRFATTAAQQENLANNWVPVPGMPRVPGRYSANAERVPEAQVAAKEAGSIAKGRQNEVEFLANTMNLLSDTVGMSEKALTPLLRRPSMREAVKAAIKSAGETGAYFPQKKGDKFSIENLQRVKMALDDIVKDPATFGIKATEAREIMATREEFVKWLGNRSPDWKAARLQYKADSGPINRMEVGQKLEEKLAAPGTDAERATVFHNAVRDEAATIKRSTGQSVAKNLDEILTPGEMQTVEGVGKDLARKAETEAMGRVGSPAAAKIVGVQDTPPQATGMLSRTVTIANAVLRRLHGTDIAMKEVAKRMQDPKEMARIMEAATATERKELTEALVRQSTAAVPAVTAGNAVEAKNLKEAPKPAAPPPKAPEPVKYEPAPRDAAKRVAGTTYETPKGPFKWTGKSWTKP